jgi:hypothetical protein
MAVADVYAATFSARVDAYSSFRGGTWICMKEPLTAAVIEAAWHGGPSVSGYTINPDNRTHVGCIDFDSADGLVLAKQVRGAMADKGVTGYVEVSREGRAHLWVLLDRETPARTVRRALMAFLGDCGLSWAPDNPKIELRPAQDEIKPDGYGYPIRMPTMPNHKTGRRYPMLGPDDKPLSPRIDEMLLAIDFSPAWVFAAMADTIRPTLKDMTRGDRHAYTGPAVEGSASDILRRLWGVQDARPNHTVKCPAHVDKVPSLSILADDQRVCCKAPSCDLYNDGRGRGTYELTTMAPTAMRGTT